MRLVIPILALLLAGCIAVRAEFKGEVIAATDQSSEPASPEAEPSSEDASSDASGDTTIEDLIARDAEKAAAILNDALHHTNRRAAGYAAVYLRRLGLVHDAIVARDAMVDGTRESDDVLNALCWRWIAADDAPLPAWKGNASADPVVAALAGVAYAAHGKKLPKSLKWALALKKLPNSAPDGWEPDTLEVLVNPLMPYDDGPLGLAIAFVDARRDDLLERDADGTPVWVAARFRTELFQSVSGADPKGAFGTRASFDAPTRIPDRLNTALISQPLDKLRAVIVQSSGSLRIEALRALAVSAIAPVAADFAAAAAALESNAILVQVEAARTYLLFTARATVKD